MRYVIRNRFKGPIALTLPSPTGKGDSLSVWEKARMRDRPGTKLCHSATLLCLFFFLLLDASSFAEEKTSAERMLAQLDRIRLPARSFVADLSITDFRE